MPAQPAPISSVRIVADDLSGAADCAASFATVAGPVPVLLGGASHEGPCVAVDTASRAMTEREAIAAVARAFDQLDGRAQLVYKKIDSTLRGHVGAELAAALRTRRFDGALVAPAFPEQGRTMLGGRLLVHGHAPDLGHSNDLMAMLDAAGLRPALLSPPFGPPAPLAARIVALVGEGAGSIAIDASTQADLVAVAAAVREVQPRLLVAGSAGLARALAPHVAPGVSGLPAPRGVSPGAVLMLVGSFSVASAEQVAVVERSGVAQVVRLTPAEWLDAAHAAGRARSAVEAQRALAAGRHVLFAIAGAVRQPFTRAVVEAMARLAAPLLPQANACVLTGGDTAHALLRELRSTRLDVAGDFEPGVSIGSLSAQPGRAFILKAGAFGDAAVLRRIIGRFGASS